MTQCVMKTGFTVRIASVTCINNSLDKENFKIRSFAKFIYTQKLIYLVFNLLLPPRIEYNNRKTISGSCIVSICDFFFLKKSKI